MDDIQSLTQRLEALEIVNEALDIRLDAYLMTDPARHAELLERCMRELSDYEQQLQDEKTARIKAELEERIERSRLRRVHFVIQKPRDEYGFIRRPYHRKSDQAEEEPQTPRELTYEDQLQQGPMGSGIKDARVIARFFLSNEMVSVEGLITATGESRTVVNYYLRLFKSQGYITYIAEDKYYTASNEGRSYFNELLSGGGATD
jgi:hypothetical protein